jgi:RNA polymerase sigma-70 factor (ECF subfamily)
MADDDPAPNGRTVQEAEIKAACRAGDHDRALTVLLQTYGDELLSFLVVHLRDRSHAEEAFALLAEDLWLSLPKFEFRSSARTWAYTLARHSAARYARSPARRKERNLTLSRNVPLSQLVDELRTRTQGYARTEVKDRVRALREQLDPEDQMLLVLRVDRQLAWRDLALVMAASPEDVDRVILDAAAMEREGARLRKRFERVKQELKRLAKDAGLLS